MPPIKLQLRPLSDLEGCRRWDHVLFVWQTDGFVGFAKMDTLVGVQAAHDWGTKMPMPDGWVEAVEVAQ
jgi:hypothetical protein